MARKRLPDLTLKTWADAESTLKEIGQLQRDLGMYETELQQRLEDETTKFQSQSAPLVARIEAREAALKAFCEANRTEFAEPRTKVFPYGSLGFRLSTKLVVKSPENALDALERLGLSQYVRVKKSLDRDLMKQEMSDEALALVGAIRQTSDVFWYETDFGMEN